MDIAQPQAPRGVPTADSVTEQLRAYQALRNCHRAWDLAAEVLRKALGVPLCVESCGLCCDFNVPVALEVEADYAISILLGRPKAEQDAIVSTIEGWLTEFDPARGLTLAVGHPAEPDEVQRLAWAVQQTRCPLLSADKQCLLHEARPMSCRAFGVTMPTIPGCRRPKPVGAPEGATGYWLEGGEVEQQLAGYVNALAAAAKPRCGFFPTLIFSRLREARFRELWEQEAMPLGKIVTGVTRVPWRLFANQVPPRDVQERIARAAETMARSDNCPHG